ncbi:MAG TPA: hypothetical protein VF668_04270 [Pyrinomonadaceae bacterium]|jgi:hypothetical protein
MRLTERDRLVLARALTFLPWFGLLCWSLSYSFWLGAALALYVNFDRRLYLKYWGPESFRGEGL